MEHPIYIGYYSHEDADCYKINLPWSKYARNTEVLCNIDKGYEYARLLAIGVICKHITEITVEPPKSDRE